MALALELLAYIGVRKKWWLLPIVVNRSCSVAC